MWLILDTLIRSPCKVFCRYSLWEENFRMKLQHLFSFWSILIVLNLYLLKNYQKLSLLVPLVCFHCQSRPSPENTPKTLLWLPSFSWWNLSLPFKYVAPAWKIFLKPLMFSKLDRKFWNEVAAAVFILVNSKNCTKIVTLDAPGLFLLPNPPLP